MYLNMCGIRQSTKLKNRILLGFVLFYISYRLCLFADVFTLCALLITQLLLVADYHLGWNSCLVAALPSMCIAWVCSCAHGSCMHSCNAQKGYNHSQKFRVSNLSIWRTQLQGKWLSNKGIKLLSSYTSGMKFRKQAFKYDVKLPMELLCY